MPPDEKVMSGSSPAVPDTPSVEKVAMPLTASTVVSPTRVAPAEMVAVTCALLVATRLSPESRTSITIARLNG